MELYRRLARPALFALPPEAAHHVAQAMLRLPLPWSRIGGLQAAGYRVESVVSLRPKD